MQMLQRPKEGRVNVSCRLRGTSKHRSCYQAWVVSSENVLTNRDTTSSFRNIIELKAHQLHLHGCAELGIQPGAPSQVP